MSLRGEFLRCGRALGLEGPGGVKAALLGKENRYAPDREFDTAHVFLELELDFSRRVAFGECRTTIRPFKAGLRVVEFDAVALEVQKASVNGLPAKFVAKDGKLRITSPKPLSAGEEAEIAVRYRVEKPTAGLHFVYPGPHNPKNPVQVWSQSQPEDARHWYPCHDNPHEKCTSEARITVPEGFRAISNGALVETFKSRGKVTWHWRMDRPHAVYLISIAAGRFSELEDRWQDVPVTYYCEKGREADARRGFGKTVKAMEFFSEITGVPYPYDKYAQVAVAEYPGGMEHTTCTTQTDACLIDARASLDVDLDLLVAHELAHQWFGDLVTCRDWTHAWLNEGFATYFEILFQAHDKGEDEADYELYHNASAYFDEDSRRYRRPIVCATYKYAWTLFDRHTYEKGAWVLHMLRRELGEQDWRRCVRHYLEKHRDGSVETSDLISAIGEITGRNLKWFFDQWIFRAGFPNLKATYSWDPKTRKAELHVAQQQEVSDADPAYAFKLPVLFTGRGWTKSFTADVSAKEHRFSWTLPGEPIDVEVDPDYTILKKLLLRKPQAMWLRQLARGRKAYSRHYAARNAVQWPGAETAAALERQIRREPFWGAAAEMARALGGVRTEEAFQALARLVKVKHPKVRRAVVEALANFRRPETAGLVLPLARRDPSVLVEAEAVKTLGALADARGVAQMKASLSKTSYRDVVAAGGVVALASLHDPRNLETLRKMSLPPHSFARRAQAIRALADYLPVSGAVIGWIGKAAEDPDERVTLAAVAALGRTEDERALPLLEKATKHPNTRVRVYADEAIARIKGK
jgi:aminopeptidase N